MTDQAARDRIVNNLKTLAATATFLAEALDAALGEAFSQGFDAGVADTRYLFTSALELPAAKGREAQAVVLVLQNNTLAGVDAVLRTLADAEGVTVEGPQVQ